MLSIFGCDQDWPIMPLSVQIGSYLRIGNITAFIGATLYEVGGILLVLEAVNAGRVESLGSALMSDLHLNNRCGTKPNHTVQVQAVPTHRDPGTRWIWAPSWQEFSTHLVFDLGFQASFIMGIGCTVFYIAGIASIPPLFKLIDRPDLKELVYWWPLLLGGILFVVSGILYVLESQERWVRRHRLIRFSRYY